MGGASLHLGEALRERVCGARCAERDGERGRGHIGLFLPITGFRELCYSCWEIQVSLGLFFSRYSKYVR